MKKIVAFICDATGQAMNCVAIAQRLAEKNVETIFIVDQSFQGFFDSYGFKEHLLDYHGLGAEAQMAQTWSDHVERGISVFQKPTIDQIETYIAPYWGEIVDGAISADGRFQAALEWVKPDLVVIDDVIVYPSVVLSRIPWVRVVSCNPLELPDRAAPPALSGYSQYETENWDAFRGRYLKAVSPHHKKLNRYLSSRGIDPLEDGVFAPVSQYLNFLIYPEAIKYERLEKLPPNTYYMNACIRREKPFELPFAKDRPLAYIGSGSMAPSEAEMMCSWIAALADSGFRILASIGTGEGLNIENTEDVHLAEFLPQPSVIPEVDIVVHHGGNNTFNEVLFFGKPQVVLPFAWDGYDNAQRVEDLGIGRRLPRYAVKPKELAEAARALVEDAEIAGMLQRISEDMRKNPGVDLATSKIAAFL